MQIQKVNFANITLQKPYTLNKVQVNNKNNETNNCTNVLLDGIPKSYITFKAADNENKVILSEDAEELLELSVKVAKDSGSDEVRPEHVIEASVQAVETKFSEPDCNLAAIEPNELPPLCKIANNTAKKNLFQKDSDIRQFIKAVEKLADQNLERLSNQRVPDIPNKEKEIKLSDSLQDELNRLSGKIASADAGMLLGSAFNALSHKGLTYPSEFLFVFSKLALYKNKEDIKSDYLKQYDAKALDVWNKLALGSNLFITYNNEIEADRLTSSMLKTINAPKHGNFSSSNTIVNVMSEEVSPENLINEILQAQDKNPEKQKIYIVKMNNLINNIEDFQTNGFMNSDFINMVNLKDANTKFVFLQNEDIYYQLMREELTQKIFSDFLLHSLPPVHSYEAQEILNKNRKFLKDIKTPFTKEAKAKAIMYADKIKGVYPDKAVDLMNRIANYYGEEKKKITSKDVDEFAFIAHNLFNKTEDKTNIIYDTGKNLASLYGKDTSKKDAEALVRQIKTGRAGTRGIIIYSQDEEAGSGRRYLAQAIAGEAKVPFVEINTSDYALSSAADDSIKNNPKTDVHNIFVKIKKAAEQNPNKAAIVYISDFEELAFSNPYLPGYKQAMAQILKEMACAEEEDVSILVLGATREPYVDYIPLEIRGFNQSIAVDSPAFNNRSRKDIIANRINEINLPLACKTATEKEEMLNKIVKLTQYMSFVQIKSMIEKTEQIMLEREKSKASIGDFIEAYLQLSTGRTSRPEMPEYNKRATTSHECGHAVNLEVMNEILKEKGKPWHQFRDVNFITLDPRGNFLGAVFEGKSENSDYPFEAMFTGLVCAYGGYSCEKLFFDMDGSSGISQDLAQAALSAKNGIEYFGFGHNTGKISNAADIRAVKYDENVFKDMDIILTNAQIASDLITETYKHFNEWFTDKYSKLIGTDDCMIDGDTFRSALAAWKKTQPQDVKEEFAILGDMIMDIIKSSKQGKIYGKLKL